MHRVRLLATDGSLVVDKQTARECSIFIRDILALCNDEDEVVVEIPVPFDCAACDLIARAWMGPHATRMDRDVPHLCRALDFANYLQSDAAVASLAQQLREALWVLPLPPAPARPRPARGPKILPPDSSFPATHDPRMREAWTKQEWKTVERLMLEGRGLAEVWRLHTLRTTSVNVKRLVSNVWDRDLDKWPTDGYDEAERLMSGDANEFFAHEARVGLTPFAIDVLARQVVNSTAKVDPRILMWLIRTSGCNVDHTVNPDVARLMCEMEEPYTVFASWCVRHTVSDEVLACAAEFIDTKHDDGITQRLYNGGIKSTDDLHRLLSLGLNAPPMYTLEDLAYVQRVESHKPILTALLEVVQNLGTHYHGTMNHDRSQWAIWFRDTRRRVIEARTLRGCGIDEGSAKRAIAALAGL